MRVSVPNRPAARFEPRLGDQPTTAPFNPGSYYLVAFFGGVLALGYIALTNLGRITRVENTDRKTYLILAVATVAALGFLLFSPADWWSAQRNIRLGLRIVGVAAAGALYIVHRGPALGAQLRFGDYLSMWKAIGPIIVAAFGQFGLTIAVGAARGLM